MPKKPFNIYWKLLSEKRGEHNTNRKKLQKRKKKGNYSGIIRERDGYKLIAPKSIRLYDKKNSKEVIKVFHQSFHKGNNKNKIIKVYFSDATTVSVAGGIYLYGFFQYLKHHKIKYECIISKEQKSLKKLAKIEQILQYLEIKKRTIQKEDMDKNIRCWYLLKFTKPKKSSSTDTKEKPPIDTSEIHKAIKNITVPLDKKTKRYLYQACLETLGNSLQHPYTDEDTLRNFYCFIGIYSDEQHSEDHLTICIYDHGMGFFNSFKKNPSIDPYEKKNIKEKLEAIKNKVVPYNYGHIIRDIIENQKSGTKQSHRGKGLNFLMKNIHKNEKIDSMLIYSRKGFYEVRNNGDNKEQRHELPGTLVSISIPIKRDNNNEQ